MDRMDEGLRGAEVHTHIGMGPRQHHDGVDGLEELSEAGGEARSGRARNFANEARQRAAGALGRAASGLDERTGVVRLVRENPLAAVGVAFAVGFLVAGKSQSEGRFGRAKQQLRGAIIGAISAAVAQETRNLAGIFGDDEDEEEERPTGRRPRRPREY
ncbi:MAG: hypothetical protein KY464_00170 [Gemmatimonadetes bacterium]|nr:hypothetical protein [Gemmatimonadota bacterium]